MVSDVEPMAFPSRNVGGEFVGVFVAGLLPKLDAGAPYNGWIFRGKLRFYPKKIAEKIPVGFNSKESFTKMDEDGNVADRVWVEMMELKPIEIKKAAEEGTGGESQTPFREMVERDDFVYILHGKRLAKRRAPVNKIFLLKQTLRNKTQEVVIGALTVGPFPRRQLRFLPLPIFLVGSFGRQLRFLPLPIFLVGSFGRHSRSVCHELLYSHALGGCSEGVESFG
jgi:hypothetical protein